MSAMRYLLVRISLALILMPFHNPARADGKIFARAVSTSVTTPDQRALLHFSNGVERLVIDTSFKSAGTNFAWVVPLPSPPKIERVSSDFFDSLNRSFQPVVIYKFPSSGSFSPFPGSSSGPLSGTTSGMDSAGAFVGRRSSAVYLPSSPIWQFQTPS
jgi:hypothetical protein